MLAIWNAVSTIPLQRFYKEVILWETLTHPNILNLVGVQEDVRQRQFVTVSEWMEHGNITEYIKKNYANRLDLVRGLASRPLLLLKCPNSYMGQPRVCSISMVGVSHTVTSKGSVSLRFTIDPYLTVYQANILISNDTPPRACLADFGFITTILFPDQKLSESAQMEGGTMAFTAPELLVPHKFGKKEAMPTTQADIYSFGLVIFQVLEQVVVPSSVFTYTFSSGSYW